MATKRKPRPTHQAAQERAKPASGAAYEGRRDERPRLSARVRLLISAGLLFHLLGVIVPPMSVPPASELEYTGMRGIGWYANFMFTNHGYRFFAPDPGPSDMLRAEIELPDGTRLPDLIYPDLREQWPRLLYHRHFMLTSRLAQAPGDPMGWALAQSYARHLFDKHGAQEVRLSRRQHQLATREQVLRGVKLSDKSLYVTPYASPLGVWKAKSGSGTRKTDVVLDVRLGTATLRGWILGEKTDVADLRWEQGARGLMAFEDQRTRKLFGSEPIGPHEMLLRYELADGSQHPILLTREPPPLVVYGEEQP